jgi:pimeloyl-ACP methyl ester carboxylesterase
MAYYIDADDGPVGSAAPIDILAIHGMGCGKEQWLQPQTTAGIRLIAFDRLGHGESDAEPAGYGYAQMANDFTELVDSLGLTTFGLLGHGIGGGYALNFAAALIGRVVGVGIVSGA